MLLEWRLTDSVVAWRVPAGAAAVLCLPWGGGVSGSLSSFISLVYGSWVGRLVGSWGRPGDHLAARRDLRRRSGPALP